MSRLIRAEDVLEYADRNGLAIDVYDVTECVNAAPTVEVAELKNGSWLPIAPLRHSSYPLVRCSVCGKGYGEAIALADYLYCPNCGAKMYREAKR